MRRVALLALVPVLTRTLARGALRHALGPALIVMIICSVILGGFGVPVPMLGVWLLDSSTFRIALLVGWALLFLPAARGALHAPGARYMSQFPGGFVVRVILVPFVLLAPVVPLAVLVFVGGGLFAVVLALSWVLALQIVIAAPYFHWVKRLFQGASAAGLVAVLYMDSNVLSVGIALMLAIGFLPGAILRSDIESRHYLRRVLVGGTFLSLLMTHSLRLWRRERALVVRIGFVLIVGVVLMTTAWTANRGEGMEASIRLALAMQTPILAAIGIMLALAARQSMAELGWLLASLQVRSRVRMTTGWALTSLGCGASAIAIALATSPTIHVVESIWLTLCLLIHALVLAAWAHWLCHGWLSGTGNDRSRPAVLMFVLAIVLSIAISMVGHWLLIIEVVSAPLAFVYGAERRWQGA